MSGLRSSRPILLAVLLVSFVGNVLVSADDNGDASCDDPKGEVVIHAWPAAKRTKEHAQELFTAALKSNSDIMLYSTNHDADFNVKGKRLRLMGSASSDAVAQLWTSGLDIRMIEEQEHPPDHLSYYDEEYSSSYDRFAGHKTHTMTFAGFITKDLTMADIEAKCAGKCDHLDERMRRAQRRALESRYEPCPIRDCGLIAGPLENDEVPGNSWSDDTVGAHSFAMDVLRLDHYTGGPDEMKIWLCTKGCVYGYAQADLHMVGHLGWKTSEDW